MEVPLSAILSAVFGFLGGGAAVGVAILSVLRKWFEARMTEAIRAEYAGQLALQQAKFTEEHATKRRDFEREMADRQGEIQRQNSEQLKRLDQLLKIQSKHEETALTIEQLEYPLLHEVERIIRRVAEVMNHEYPELYSQPWSPDKLALGDLDGNKKVTDRKTHV